MTAQVDLLRARMHSVAIEVTSKCNLRCSYCHKSDDVLEAMPGANDDMSDQMIADLYSYCKVEGIRNVTLSLGGETTMNAGWQHRIAQFLDDPEMETFMVSNFARVLSDEDLGALSKIRSLQISFDSSELGMVRKLRSRADLRTITYNIIRLRQKGRELGQTPYIVVNCTVCRDNIGDIGNLAGFCRELGVNQLLLTEVMSITQHNPKMPETLDRLTDKEVIRFAEEIIAAQEKLEGSSTALRLQEHLEVRISELMERVREGTFVANAAASFHRSMETSACRQPWMTPMVRANGIVIPCCGVGEAGPVGDLNTTTMREIMDGDASRGIRASILAGEPIVKCRTCSFAHSMSFPEFVRDIREWQGETVGPPCESEAQPVLWPGLFGSPEYPVIIENSLLTFGHEGAATLIENRPHGLHRVLIDIQSGKHSELCFLAQPAGRLRLRLDFAKETTMVGRAHIVFTRNPKVDVTIGAITCQVVPAQDRWYKVKAQLPQEISFSHINLSLMREDNAIVYPGDGRSGLVISGLSLA
jgi:MoaA/NifB/PqqE/SkfB family radical SAM enzyme